MSNINKINGFPAVEPNPCKVPEFLRVKPFANWVAEPKAGQPGKFNKAPRNPTSGIKVGANNPASFGTYEQAVAALDTGKYSGIGVLLTGDDNLTGVDIDDYKTTFEQLPQVKAWVSKARAAGAYCELSPSSNGLRLFMRGKLPGSGRKVGPLEIYDNARFLTVTGRAAKGSGRELIDGQSLIDEYLAMLPKEAEKLTPALLGRSAADPGQVDELTKRISDKHSQLWSGDWEGGATPAVGNLSSFGVISYPSPSEADFAMCGHIAREASRLGVADDALADTIMSVFERSGLYREEKHQQVENYAIPKIIAELVSQRGKVTKAGSVEATKLPQLSLVEGVVHFSNTLPPPRDFTITDLVLMAKACLLAGFGGVSKTQWLIQAAICIAIGLSFMGKKTIAGSVLMLLGEEDQAEISRRFNAVTKAMGLSAEQIELVRQRVRAFPMVGLDMRLTRVTGGSLESTGFSDEILLAATKLEAECGFPVRLIGLDHAGLIHGGEFNAREDVVQTMRQVNHIAQESGAAVLVLAHSPKAAAGAEKSTASAVAGSTAWVDHARAAMILRTMNDDEGKKYGIDTGLRNSFASLTVVKNNYGPTGDEFWLSRKTVDGYGVGALTHVELTVPAKIIGSNNTKLRAEIYQFIQENPYLTKNAVEGCAGAKDGRIRASKGKVQTELGIMLAEEILTFRQPTEAERVRMGIKGKTDGFLCATGNRSKTTKDPENA